MLPLGSVCPVWLSPGPPSRRFPAPRSRLRVTVCRCVYHTPAVCGLQGCCGVFYTPCPLVIPSFKPIYRERFLCLPVPIFLIEGLSLCSFGGKDFILYVGIAAVLRCIPACLYDVAIWGCCKGSIIGHILSFLYRLCKALTPGPHPLPKWLVSAFLFPSSYTAPIGQTLFRALSQRLPRARHPISCKEFLYRLHSE